MLKQKGFSLIELLISLTLGSIMLSALLSMLVDTTHHFFRLQQHSRLINELQLISIVVNNNLKQAGYDAHAVTRQTAPLPSASPFANTLELGEFAGEATNSCIIFAYDKKPNGSLDLKNPNERFGYRLRDEALESRMGNAICSKGLWQDITPHDLIRISVFHVEIIEQSYMRDTRRALKITLTGHLSQQNEVSSTLQWLIPLRNNHA